MSNQQEKAPMWGVAANILKERPYGPGGQIIKRGTRKFHGGAKVYMVGAFWGMGGEQVAVVGHFRGNGYVTSVIGIDTLENFRAEHIFSPAVIHRILNRRYSVHHPSARALQSTGIKRGSGGNRSELRSLSRSVAG